jgi:hypothetical protein
MPQRRSTIASVSHRSDDELCNPDDAIVKSPMIDWGAVEITDAPWASEMRATSSKAPAQLIQTLSDAILGVGGWILSRSYDAPEKVILIFEFERHACLDIYSVLLSAGLELSANDYMWLNNLCRCTLDRIHACGKEIACIELKIITSCRAVGPDRASPMV